MPSSVFQLDNFAEKLDQLNKLQQLANSVVVEKSVEYIRKDLVPKLSKPGATWQDFKVFWPPRCVDALRNNNAVVFFGAAQELWANGVSFLLIDSNGVCILPPQNESQLRINLYRGARSRQV